MRHPTSLILDDVIFGPGEEVGAYVVVGERARGHVAGTVTTVIGAGAVLRSHAVVYAGNRIGDDFQLGHGALVREDNRIGSRVSIGTHSVVEHHVEIGDGVRIHSNAFIPEFSVLEDGCWIGPCVVFTNARYPQTPNTKASLAGPVVRRGAKIGAGAVLLPGVVIGENALIGAGAVIVKDVPAGAVVVGNPGRRVGAIDEIDDYKGSA